MNTVQEVIDLARIDLNDKGKDRWKDEELLKRFNVCLTLIFDLRPDLRLGHFADDPVRFKLTDELPPSVRKYSQAIADFIIARANAKDQEDAEMSRSSVFMTSFRAMLGVG